MTALPLTVLLSIPLLLALVWIFLRRWRLQSRIADRRLKEIESLIRDMEQQLMVTGRTCAKLLASHVGLKNGDSLQLQAQHGEELYLWSLADHKSDGVFVEVGAYDGLAFSNSLFFERIGWRGILIEPHPSLADKCQINRPGVRVFPVAVGEFDDQEVEFSMVDGVGGMDTLSFVETDQRHLNRIKSRGGSIQTVTVPLMTLDTVLKKAGLSHVDWMSIDVEGYELAVLKGLSLKEVRPSVIMIEENSEASREATHDYLTCRQYRRCFKVGCNALYKDESAS